MAAKKKSKKVAPKPKKKSVAKKAAKKVVAKKKAQPKKAQPQKAAKKVVAKKAPAKKALAKKAKAVRREDRPGHLDPKYAKTLRQQSGPSTKKDQTRGAFKYQDDDVAEDLGEEVVGKATTGEDEGEDVANEEYTEEVGGPFVVTSGSEEFADGTDESNPEDAEREPFPKT